eukprot:6159492-Pyramimonas_sp.AAC.1
METVKSGQEGELRVRRTGCTPHREVGKFRPEGLRVLLHEDLLGRGNLLVLHLSIQQQGDV